MKKKIAKKSKYKNCIERGQIIQDWSIKIVAVFRITIKCVNTGLRINANKLNNQIIKQYLTALTKNLTKWVVI